MYDSRTDKARKPKDTHRRQQMVMDAEQKVVRRKPRQAIKVAVAQQIAQDIADLRDEQAIAADGITRAYTPTRRNPRLDERPRRKQQPRFVAAKVDPVERAKAVREARRKQRVREEMAQGVVFYDLDPYTLEPYKHIRPSGFVSISTRRK